MKPSALPIPDPKGMIELLVHAHAKYRLGDQGFSFHHIKKLKPRFAFDYVSLQRSHLCFNSDKLVVGDFHQFFDGLKKLSDKTYEELKVNSYYRFHQVDFSDKRVALHEADFIRALGYDPARVSLRELPNLYQFDLLFQEARAAGFLFKGLFYLVWFDRHHSIYPWK